MTLKVDFSGRFFPLFLSPSLASHRKQTNTRKNLIAVERTEYACGMSNQTCYVHFFFLWLFSSYDLGTVKKIDAIKTDTINNNSKNNNEE